KRADLEYNDRRRSARRIERREAIECLVAGALRGAGADAGRGRHLLRHALFGHATDARDWGPHRSRRAKLARAATGHWTGDAVDIERRSDRPTRRLGADAGDGAFAL